MTPEQKIASLRTSAIWREPVQRESDPPDVWIARYQEALSLIAWKGCRVVHSGYPRGFTCLDKRADAIEPTVYGSYAEPHRSKLIAGEGLCDPCRARAALNGISINSPGESQT